MTLHDQAALIFKASDGTIINQFQHSMSDKVAYDPYSRTSLIGGSSTEGYRVVFT